MATGLRFVVVSMALVAMCLGLNPLARADALPIRVEIHYNWGGLGPSHSETFVIANAKTGYVLEGDQVEGDWGMLLPRSAKPQSMHVSQPLPDAAVLRLRDAILAPDVGRAQFISEYANPAWLRDHAADAYSTVANSRNCSLAARDLFFREFTSPEKAAKSLSNYLESRWTDDYPSAGITLAVPGRPPVELRTGAQQDLMLPWIRGTKETWNRDVSLALWTLLPEVSQLRARLSGRQILKGLAEHVLGSVQDEWSDIELRCEHKDVVQLLEKRFEILQLYDSFAGYLRNQSMPPNLAVNPVLDVETPEKARVEVATFLRVVDKYIELSKPFVLSHPEIKFTLWYRGGVSFSELGTTGSDDPSSEEEVKPYAAESVLLREHDYWNGRQWVVLPSGKVVEWRKRPEGDSRRPNPAW